MQRPPELQSCHQKVQAYVIEFSSETIKMYSVAFSLFVISNLAIADILPISVITNAVFAILGFMCGNKFMPSETKDEANIKNGNKPPSA